MHYYTFNIGDYRRDTSYLSLLEHGIYRQLIDSYYLSELPLPADEDLLMRTHSVRTAEEMQALKNVLQDFFVLQEDGWHHRGCEKIIASYREKSAKASASAKARWDKDANALPTQSERYANHKPITNNHKPITNKKNIGGAEAPSDVQEAVWKDFVAMRKAKRSPVTERVIDGIRHEAEKAGWDLNRAISECVVRGWQSFKADWVRDKQPFHAVNKQEAIEARNRAVVERMIERDRANGII